MTYHVTLAGQGLLLDLQSYSRRLAEPFAGKVASGERSYGDLRDEIVVLVDEWTGGEGWIRHDPDHPERYRRGPGLDGWSEPGAIRQGPHAVAIASGFGDPGAAPMVAALGNLYVGIVGGYAWSWDGSTVGALGPITGGNVASLCEYQGKLYLGKTGNGTIARWDGSVFTDVFLTLPAPVTACHSMGVFYRGSVAYLYLVGEAPDGCRIYYTDGISLSTLRYQLNEPSCRVLPQVIGQTCVFFGSVLGSGARTGVYSLVDNGGAERWAFNTTLPGVALTAGSVLGDAAYLAGYRGSASYPEVYRWRGGQMELLDHPLPVPYPAGAPTGAATGQGAWWLGSGDGVNPGVKRYDAAADAWGEAVAPAVMASHGQMRGLGWYGGDLYGTTSNGSIVYLWRFRSDQFAAAATLETGLMDARLPGISKVWRSVTLTHAALLSGQSVEVLYRLDDSGSWISLGTQSAVGSTSAAFTFPAAVVGKVIAFRVVLTGTAGAGSPVKVYSLEARCRPVPGAKRIWELECLVEGTASMPLVLLDGSNSAQTGAQLSAVLWSLAGQSGPLTYVDLDGVSRSV